MRRCVMLDVDGVVVTGRPADGAHWSTGLESDLGVSPDALKDVFFKDHWEGIVTGRCDLMPVMVKCLRELDAPVSARQLIDYWFAMDSRLDVAVLESCRNLR